ncbi:MAG: nicotinamide mononucleotide transporter [Clostridia bacterium]|nr:nicotinamide mononucleotide transporter [Clostridia bacterium]
MKKALHALKALARSFTPYQIAYLSVVFLITVLFAVFFPDLMLEDTSNTFVVICSVIAVLANPVCELLISKQSGVNFFVDLLFIEIPEFIICLVNGWYAIALVTLVFWIPVDVISIVRWLRHRDEKREELTVVRRLTPKQDVAILLAILAFGFGAGYLFSLIPGASESYLDAFSATFGMANGILLLLRYNEQWYAWFITLIFYAALYITGGAYILLVTVAAMLVNTCYGYVKWLKYAKEREKENAAKAAAD